MAEALRVLGELRSHLDAGTSRELYVRAHEEGFRLLALFADGECCAVAGFRIGTSFANGRYLYVDDLVTSSARRSRGYGKMLIRTGLGGGQGGGMRLRHARLRRPPVRSA